MTQMWHNKKYVAKTKKLKRDCQVISVRNADILQKRYPNVIKNKIFQGTWNNVAVNHCMDIQY